MEGLLVMIFGSMKIPRRIGDHRRPWEAMGGREREKEERDKKRSQDPTDLLQYVEGGHREDIPGVGDFEGTKDEERGVFFGLSVVNRYIGLNIPPPCLG